MVGEPAIQEEVDACNTSVMSELSALSASVDSRPMTPLAGVEAEVDLSSPGRRASNQEQPVARALANSKGGEGGENAGTAVAAESKSGGCCCVVQ